MKKQPTPMAQLTEQALDAMLQSANIPAPYDGLIPKISPWRQSMKLLVWGMMFTSIKLEFWNLHYILPALGAILFLLALLPLRRESGWFRLAFWGSIGQFLHTAITLFLQGTIWHNRFMDTALGTILNVSAWFFFFAIYFAPLLGLAHLSRKSGCPPPNKRLVGFMLLSMGAYFYMGLAAALPSFLPLLAFAVYFYLLLRLLRQAFREMDQVGYLIQSRPARLSALPLGVLLAGFLIGCTAVSMTVGQSYPMDWQPTDLRQEHQEQEALMAELVALGMPEHILADLTAEDVSSLAGAKEISVGQTDFVLSPQGQLQRTTPSLPNPDLTLSIIAVSFTDPSKHVQMLYHFHWLTNTEWGHTAAITVSDNFLVSEEFPFRGRVLYEQNTQTYSSAYYNDFIVQTNPVATFSGIHILAATFSPPEQYMQLRGYLLVSAEDFSTAWTVPGNMRCYFRTDKKTFPAPDVITAAKNIFSFGDSNRGFHLVQAYFAFNME